MRTARCGRIDHEDVAVNLFLGSEIEGGPANLWLRRRSGRASDRIPLRATMARPRE